MIPPPINNTGSIGIIYCMSKKPFYSGVILTPQSRDLLLKQFPAKEGFRVICHHVTLNLGGLDESLGYQIGDKVKFHATHYGEYGDSVAALKVVGVNSRNATPHITLGCSSTGKPVMSNLIQEWIALEEAIPLEGYVEEQ